METTAAPSQTLMDHISELRSRLLRVFLALFAGLALGWSFQEQVVALLLRPAGQQTFIYTAPAGGFQLVFHASLIIGFLIATPVLVLQIAKFIAPVLRRSTNRHLYGITFASSALALTGAAFAYLFSLPLALEFLSKFGGEQVTTLLSVDSYLSFALLYIGGYALLFQLPLLMYIGNNVTPLPPSRLLKSERFVVLGSFIVGAILTPTPDLVNQLILAGPMIILYQFGILIIWLTNGIKNRSSTSPGVLEQLDKSFDSWFAEHYGQPAATSHRPVMTQATVIPSIEPQTVEEPVIQEPAASYGRPIIVDIS